MDILKVEHLNRNFGGLEAVNNVSFTLQEGMIKAVIGPNGAGKTTLFHLISGFLPWDSGTVLFNRQPIHGLMPYQITAMGLSRTFQHVKLFPEMTTLENIKIGRHIHSKAGFIAGMLNLPWTWKEEREIEEKSLEIMAFLDILDLADREATSLPYGQQRIVEIARALACNPKLLLLDEPAAGLNMRETREMSQVITRIRDMGITILIVEHDMSLVMDISDEIMVLSYGQKVAEDEPLAIQKNEEVIRVYLGEEDA